MIFGSEGLPRSGKSLEAMQHILDALVRGRTVITNIHGVQLKAISEYLSIPLPTIERLLISFSPPKELDEELVVPWVKAEFLKYSAVPNAFWIWDEINQFWPPDRQPLSAVWAKFVTEHGHLGIDILIMGQDLTELHTTWRKRLQRYTRYTKLDMMGKEDSFHWASYSNSGRNKFKRTADGKKPYNKDFFPLYQSHREDTQNKDNYKDKRYGVFQTKHKVYGVIFGLILIYALYYVWGFFHHTPPVPVGVKSSQNSSQVVPGAEDKKPAVVVKPETKATKVVESVATVTKPEPIDYLDKIATKFDLRLSGIIERSARPGDDHFKPESGDTRPWFDFQIDAVDTSYRVKERFNRAAIAALGWEIERTEYGIKLSKQGVVYVVRPWPLDNFGKVSQQAISDIRQASGTSQLAEPSRRGGDVSSTNGSPAGAAFTVVTDSSHTPRTLN